MKNVSEIIKTYENISLKRVAEELNLCYQYILKASKLPIKGQPYDPEAFNDEEVNKIINRKGINLEEIDWEEISNRCRKIEKSDELEAFQVGVQFKLREKVEHIYEIIYNTETHTVFKDIEGTQPRVMNWDTFEHQSPRIVKTKK